VARQVAIEGTVTDGGKRLATRRSGCEASDRRDRSRCPRRRGGFGFAEHCRRARYQLFAGRKRSRRARWCRGGSAPDTVRTRRAPPRGCAIRGRYVRDRPHRRRAPGWRRRSSSPVGRRPGARYARSGVRRFLRPDRGRAAERRWRAERVRPRVTEPGGHRARGGVAFPRSRSIWRDVSTAGVLDGDGHRSPAPPCGSLSAGSSPNRGCRPEVDRDKRGGLSGRTAAAGSGVVGPARSRPIRSSSRARARRVMVGPIHRFSRRPARTVARPRIRDRFRASRGEPPG